MGRKSTASKMNRNKSTSPVNYKQTQTQTKPNTQPSSINSNPGLLSNVAQGAAMGAGMSIGHSIINSISSESRTHDSHDNTTIEPSMNVDMPPNPITHLNPITNFNHTNINCEQEMNEFQTCLTKNQGQINFCKEYFNMLDLCRGNTRF